MLTYYRVRSAFEANKALPSEKIYTFKTSFGLNYFKNKIVLLTGSTGKTGQRV